MASLPPLLPTPPASIKLRDTDAVESPSPKRHRPLEPDGSGSRSREPNLPPSSRARARRSPPSKDRRLSRAPPPSKVWLRSRSSPSSKARRRSRSPSPYIVRHRLRSPSPYIVQRRSRSSPPRRSRSPLPSKVPRQSRSPSPFSVRRRSRSPPPYKVRRRSRSPSPSRVRRRSRSPPPSRVRRRSRSPSPSRVRPRSRSPSPYRVRCRSRSPPPSKVRRQSRSRSPSKVRLRSRSRSPSRVRRRSRSPPPSRVRRRSRSTSPSRVRPLSSSPPPSKVQRGSRSPPYVSRQAELQRAKRLSAEAAVEGERVSLSPSDDSSMENQPSHSNNNCKAPSRNAHRKKIKRQRRAEAKKETGEAPSRNDRRKRMKREIWAEAKKEFREMKKDKLFENIKKLQSCIWLLEKDGADMAEIMEFRSLLETTKKQYVENEAQLAKEGSSAPLQVLKRDRLDKMHGMAAPVEKVERDEQNMDSGKVEGSDAVSEQNELAEEVNHLKSELETVRENRDYQLAQAQSLMADVAKQKEVARRYGVELEDAMRRVASLEEGCLLRRETIKALQIQLASAKKKLTVPSPTRD